MNSKMAMLVVALVLLLVALPAVALAQGQSDVAEVRAMAAQFHRTEVAQAAGWDYVPGLDHCFYMEGEGAMGYHLINVGLLDAVVDALQPEAFVYAPGPKGQLRLGAVEYVVPLAVWGADQEPPTLFGQEFQVNEALQIWALHVWLFKNNPDGMFASWNPLVSCP